MLRQLIKVSLMAVSSDCVTVATSSGACAPSLFQEYRTTGRVVKKICARMRERERGEERERERESTSFLSLSPFLSPVSLSRKKDKNKKKGIFFLSLFNFFFVPFPPSFAPFLDTPWVFPRKTICFSLPNLLRPSINQKSPYQGF